MFIKAPAKQHYVKAESNFAFNTFTGVLYELLEKN